MFKYTISFIGSNYEVSIKSIKPNKGYEAAKAVMSILQSGPKKI